VELAVVNVCGPRLDQIQIQLLEEATGDRTLGEVGQTDGEIVGKGRSN